MKKLFLVFIGFSLLVGNSAAQYGYAPSAAELSRRMSYDDPYLYQRYKSGKALAGVGIGLTFGGFGTMVIGYMAADKQTVTTRTSAEVKLTGPGAGVFAAGMLCTLAGIPIWIVGSVKKKNARNAYLRDYGYGYQVPVQSSPYLQLNPAPNGVQLAFVF